MSQPTSRKWLSGEGMPNTKKLPLLSAELGVSVGTLLGLSDYEKRKLANEARKLAEFFDGLEPEQQQQIDQYIELHRRGMGRKKR